MKDRPVGIGAQHDVAELLGSRQAPLSLDVHLDLLILVDRRRADASDRRLDVLRAQRVDDVARRQVEADQPLHVEPDAHRVVEAREQQRLADAADARKLVENVDGDVIGDEQRILFALLAGEADELQHRRRALPDGQALLLDFLRQLRQRGLHAVVDGDRVKVGVGAEREADGEIVAAVVAAGRLHVQHLVDADDLRFQGLGDARFHHLGGGAGKNRRDLHLRRHDVRVLRDRHAGHRQQAAERDHDRDDDRQARPIDEDRRDHRLGPAAGDVATAGPAETVWPGRTRCNPSTMTSCPSCNPLEIAAEVGVDWPSLTP